MKKLILLLLLPSLAFGQIRVRDRYYGKGNPAITPSTNQAIFTDTITGNTWRWFSSRWNTEQNAYIKGVGVKGDPGEQGQAGRDGIDGKDGAPGVCPTCPPSGGGAFPWHVIVASGGDDTPALQAAINANRTDNKPIYTVGNIRDTKLTLNKDNYRFTLIGYGSKWTLTSGTAAIQRTMPIDNSDANIYIVARHSIEGLEFVGNSSAICLDLGASYMSVYRNLKFDSYKEAIHLRFALRTSVINCEAVNCISPFIADIGNWTGANNFNSQSNHTTFDACRAYMPPNGLVAFGVYAASGCVVRDCIIEGHVVSRGIDFDGLGSTVVKDFTIENVHFECVNGATDCFIRTRILGGTVTINKAFGQYASIFLDASSTSGLGFVQVSNVPWWVAKNGKLFRSSNTALDFKYNEAFRGIGASMWEGTAPALCGGAGCGYHKYTYTDVPR